MASDLKSADYEVVATAPGYQEVRRQVSLASGQVLSVELEFSPAMSLSGAVVAVARNEPVVGAEVVLTSPRHEVRVSTDAAGRFVIDGVGESESVGVLTVSAPGFVRHTERVRLPDGRARVIALASAGWIDGSVAGAQRTDDVRVLAVESSFGPTVEARASASGTFSLEVPAGRYAVYAEESGTVSKASEIAVQVGQTRSGVTLVLSSGAHVFGTVFDKDSGNATRGTVVLSAVGRESILKEVDTDSAGQYVLEGVPSGAFDLAARVPGAVGQPLQSLEIPSSGGVRADLTVERGAQIEVNVQDENATPVGMARVSFAYSGFATDSSLPSAITDSAGRVVLEGVPVSTLWLLVRDPKTGGSQRMRLDVKAGRTRHEIVLSSRPLRLKGNVRRSSGLSAGPILVRFRRDNPQSWVETIAGSDGSFEALLATGKWRIAASQGARSSAMVLVDVATDNQVVDLLLEDEPRMDRICVLDADRLPVPGARVYYHSATTGSGMVAADFDGCAKLGPFSDNQVSVAAESGARRGVGLLIKSAGRADVVLSDGGRIQGSVSGVPDGVPIVVDLPTDPQIRPSGVTRTFAGPVFDLEAPIGKWVMNVMSRDGRRGSVVVHVRTGEVSRVAVALQYP